MAQKEDTMIETEKLMEATEFQVFQSCNGLDELTSWLSREILLKRTAEIFQVVDLLLLFGCVTDSLARSTHLERLNERYEILALWHQMKKIMEAHRRKP